ncbi:VWA domain-containing protein [Granulicella arctica]|uniref:VWFA-related protein n=1 Tax=Granulicella arctica TaxID=940613 RepID=A0A7Y9TLD3_9BACT|nr:VWA domain-containing protein [Granulicella arctica]NYF80007.1 VWFA-related protein [Granulicella arctica]
MMTPHTNSPASTASLRMHLAAALVLAIFALPAAARAQSSPPQTPSSDQSPDAGPQTDNGTIILKKKKDPDADEPPPPPAPETPKVKNPDNATYSLRVDVPIVNLDVNVVLDKTHQFVPGLKPANFLVLEDGVEQQVQTVRMAQTPITAVMLLEFAANSYYLINDMRNASYSFFQTMRPDDYVAVITYDLKTHILTDFTNNKDVVAQSLQTLTIPGFSDTDMFDALYETLDRTSRIEGRKYIILIGSGRDTFSKLTLDKILAKVKATPNVTIFTIGTGAFLNEMSGSRGGMSSGIRDLNYLQAQNQLKTFAQMTGGLSFSPIFQGELPDIFSQINNSIRNQYVLTYRPTNTKNDGRYRRVKVLLVDNEGHPLQMQDEKHKPLKYSIIARDGYRAKLPVE